MNLRWTTEIRITEEKKITAKNNGNNNMKNTQN